MTLPLLRVWVFVPPVLSAGCAAAVQLADFTVTEQPVAQPTQAARTVLFVQSPPPPVWRAAALAAGLHVDVAASAPFPDADVLVAADAALADEKIASALAAAADRGATVLLGLGHFERPHAALERVLPCTPWTLRNDGLRRYETPVRIPDGSPLTGLDVTGLVLPWRADLHLPTALIESAEHRYHWEQMAKPILNTDWRVLLAAGVDGRLPLLIDGRSGSGRVAVFACDLFEPRLLATPGYPAFVNAIVAWLHKESQPVAVAAAAQPTGIALDIPRLQSDGLSVTVSNTGAAPACLLLSAKVTDWERELLAVHTQTILVPARGSLRVPLPARTAVIGDPRVSGIAERELPWRRVQVGVATPDRRHLLAEKRATVYTAPALTVAVEEDTSTYGDLADWPAPLEPYDGVIGQRYVYRPGVQPRVRLRVRNAFADIAPLAVARDTGWPQNPTVNGLNDLSYTHADLRGLLPLQGAWSGRSAATQDIALEWAVPVWLAGQRLCGMGTHRRWNRANPHDFEVKADTESVARETNAAFTAYAGTVRAYHEARWPAVRTQALGLRVTGLDPKASLEPRHTSPANCTVLEWETWGWPGETLPEPFIGTLEGTANDLATGAQIARPACPVSVPPLDEQILSFALPAKTTFGPMRYDLVLKDNQGVIRTTAQFDVLFVPDGHTQLINKQKLAAREIGLLCTPGWVAADPFGKGMRDWTQGWGGPHDKIWAMSLGLMEIGMNARDAASRMFTTATRSSHYSHPWREMPDGTYSWDMVAAQFLDQLRRGDGGYKGGPVHVVGSDRWNGINVATAWDWSDFTAFDRHLRATEGKGLKGRSRGEIATEITAEHGDVWQRWQLERYADHLLDTQKTYRDAGIDWTFESHGSFPMCGGATGAKLARTHVGVGTDTFWELRRQDLLWTLGTRFAVVAANPDLRSGAYCQWGWDNSDLNRYWFANNGSVNCARRQWYATYFLGRVDLEGRFQPYHVLGFGSQGNNGTQFTPTDTRHYVRTVNLMTQVRPEAPAGFGLVVSWASVERRMSPRLAAQGFGLYPGKCWTPLEEQVAEVYQRLVKNGVPVGFVTSTHALHAWKGTNPLIVVDGGSLEAWEFDELRRLSRGGAPVIAIGDSKDGNREQAAAFYGSTDVATRRENLPGGLTLSIRTTGGAAPVAFCPTDGRALPGDALPALAHAVLELAGSPLTAPPGVAVTPMVSHGCLWLLCADQGDFNRRATCTLRPSAWLPSLDAARLRVVDVDEAIVLPHRADASGAVTFDFALPASSGRAFLLMEAPR